MKFKDDLDVTHAPLQDLIELVIDYRGKTPKKLGGDFVESGIPVISAIHIKRGKIIWEERERFVSPEMYEKWMKEPLKKGDVLLTSEAPLGEVALVPSDDELVLSQRLFALRTKKELLDSRFLMYFFQSAIGQEALKSRSSGSTVIGIRQAELLKIEIPIPPLSEQKAIGDFLETLDSLISVNEQIAKNLEEIAQVFFKSWFIDFEPVKAKMAGQPPEGMDAVTAALFPNSFAESELGPIPDCWEVHAADSIFDVGIGRTPPRKESKWFCSGKVEVPWVSIRDMGTFQVFSQETSESLTQSAVEKFRVPVVPENTVLMSFKLTVGKLCITDRPLVTNEAIAHFKLKSQSPLDSYFTYLWIKNLDVATLDSTSSIGTATNSGVIRKIKFLVPQNDILAKFRETVSPLFEQIKLLQQQTANLVNIRDALLPRLISGELQIPDEMLV